MSFNENYLPKSDVVFTIMFLNKTLCEKTLNIILGETIELVDIVAESKNNLQKAALNSIYFDIKTQAKDGRIITLDLQRKYIKNRIRNRTVYYACREISSQQVKKGKYEDLKNVIVTFVLTEAPLDPTLDNSKIQLYTHVGEKYSDLLTIHEVNIRRINNNNDKDLQILKNFFEIDSNEKFDNFVLNYNDTEFGNLLLNCYISATSDVSLLNKLSEEEKFMIKLSDEERIEERQEGRKEGHEEGLKEGLKEGRIQIAKKLLQNGLDIKFICDTTGLSVNEIENLKIPQ